MIGSRAWRRAEPVGRLLLLGAVVFWWGAIVLPQLFSMAFPDLLSWTTLPRQLNPDIEGTLANAVSALSLAVVAFLALGNTVREFRIQNARKNWTAIGSWAVLAVTAVYLTVDETFDPRTMSIFDRLGQTPLSEAYENDLWIVVFGPLIVAFVAAMGIFVLRGPLYRRVRILFILGFIAWLLAIAHDLFHEPLFEDLVPIKTIGRLLEETLEFSGALLIGLGAAISLWGRPEPASDTWSRHKFVIGAAAIFACIVAFGVLAPRLYKWPLADARADTLAGAFQMVLHDEHSIVQELGVLPAPPSRVDLRIANRSASNRPGVLAWRLIEPEEGISGKTLREGRKEIPSRDHLDWETIDVAPHVQSGGRPFALQLIADVGPDAHLRIGATKTDRYGEGGSGLTARSAGRTRTSSS